MLRDGDWLTDTRETVVQSILLKCITNLLEETVQLTVICCNAGLVFQRVPILRIATGRLMPYKTCCDIFLIS